MVGKKSAYTVIGLLFFLLLVPLGSFTMQTPLESVTATNDFLPLASAQSDEIEMITCDKEIPYYDQEVEGDWNTNPDRELTMTPMPHTIPKFAFDLHDNLIYQVEVDDDGMCIVFYDEDYLLDQMGLAGGTPPDPTPDLIVGDFETFSIFVDPADDEGVYTYETHGQYINDFGEWKPYLVYDEDDFIKIQFANTDYVFDKTTGAVTTFDLGVMVVDSDSYVIRTAELGTDDWSNLEINNETIETTVEVNEDLNGNEMVVTFIRTNDEGVYALEHKVRHGMQFPELKTTAKFTNAIFPNHKFAFTETVDLPSNIISVNNEEIDLNNYIGQSFPREVLEQNATLIMEIQSIYYNAFLGFHNLWSVNILTPESDMGAKVSLDYANVQETQTAIGETHELDPIWGAGAQNDQANQDECYGGGCGNNTVSKRLYVYSYNSIWNAQGSCLATGYPPANPPTYWDATGVAFFVQENYIGIGMGDNNCTTTALEYDIGNLRDVNATITEVYMGHNHNLGGGAYGDLTGNPYPWQCQSVPSNILACATGQVHSGWTDNTVVRPSSTADFGGWAANSVNPGILWDSTYMNFNANYAEDGVAPNEFESAWETQQPHFYKFSQQAVTDMQNQLNLTPCVTTGDCWFSVIHHPVGFPTKVCSATSAPNCTGGDVDMMAGWANLGVKFTTPPSPPTTLATSQSAPNQADLTWTHSDWTEDPQRDSTGNSGYFVSNVAHPSTDFTGGGSNTYFCQGMGSGFLGNPTSPTYGVVGSHGTAIRTNGICDYIGVNSSGQTVSGNTNDAGGVPTNEYSINVWLKPECETMKHNGGVSWGYTEICQHFPVGNNSGGSALGYMSLNGGESSCGIWESISVPSQNPCGNYYDKNIISVNGLYSEEHIVHAWNYTQSQHGCTYQGAGSWLQPNGNPCYFPYNGSKHSDQWYMITVTVDGANDTHAYINGNEINLWTHPGACMGGTTMDHGNVNGILGYGYGVLPGVPQSANYNGCSATYQTNVGSKHGGQMLDIAIGCGYHGAGVCKYPFKGGIDEVSVWNKILTQADITALYGGTNSNMGNPIGGQGTHCTWTCHAGYATYPTVVADWKDHLKTYLPFEEAGNPTKNMAVLVDPDSAEYNIIRDGATIDTGITEDFYDDTTVSGGTTYVYEITTTTSTGTSANSNTSSIAIAGVPDQVTGLVGTNGIPPQIDWNTPASDQPITNYKIYRDASLHDTLGVVNTYQDTTNVVNGSTYVYEVSAVSSIGEGQKSASVSVQASLPPQSAVLNVQASITNPSTDPLLVSLEWDETTDWGTGTPTSYTILEDVGSTGTFVSVGSVSYVAGHINTTYTITNSQPNTNYDYKILAVSTHGTSPDSNVAQVTTANVPDPPTSVTNVIDDPDSNPYEIKVQWNAGADGGTNLTGYRIDRYDSSTTTWTTIVADTGSLATTYIETVPSLVDTQFQYKIASINGIGESTLSVESVAVTTPDYPDPPINLVLTLDPDNATTIYVSWDVPLDDGGSAINDFAIYRGTVGAMLSYINPTGNTDTTLDDTPVALSSQYCYEITTANAVGWSQKSSNVCVTTHGVPDPPSTLTILLDDSTALGGQVTKFVTLAWTDSPSYNGGTFSHFTVERNIDGAGWLPAIVATTSFSATDNGLTAGVDYQYRVTSTSQIGTSNPGGSINAIFSTGTLALTGGYLAGNTVHMIPEITIAEAQPNPTATELKIYDTTNSPVVDLIFEDTFAQALTPTVAHSFGTTYAYPTGEADDIHVYTAWVWTTQDDSTTVYESTPLSITVLQPFSNNIWGYESRSSNYTSSDWTFIAQPANYDLIIRYQHQNPQEDPIFFGYENIVADVSDQIPVLANANYYISAYLNPIAFDYTINAQNEVTEIKCNENSPNISACVVGGIGTLLDNVPSGTPSEFVIVSEKDPDATTGQPLGIEGMGDFFGMPMVFLFIIGFASVFTSRTGHMGIVIIGALIGIMFAMGYLSFGDPTTDMTVWGLLIVTIILGVILGKKYI